MCLLPNTPNTCNHSKFPISGTRSGREMEQTCKAMLVQAAHSGSSSLDNLKQVQTQNKGHVVWLISRLKRWRNCWSLGRTNRKCWSDKKTERMWRLKQRWQKQNKDTDNLHMDSRQLSCFSDMGQNQHSSSLHFPIFYWVKSERFILILLFRILSKTFLNILLLVLLL